ncbi:hypothetical protein [Anaerotignum neopropionicum]|nr:hypothetical protein [Anaerotignum neopropionicum]
MVEEIIQLARKKIVGIVPLLRGYDAQLMAAQHIPLPGCVANTANR